MCCMNINKYMELIILAPAALLHQLISSLMKERSVCRIRHSQREGKKVVSFDVNCTTRRNILLGCFLCLIIFCATIFAKSNSLYTNNAGNNLLILQGLSSSVVSGYNRKNFTKTQRRKNCTTQEEKEEDRFFPTIAWIGPV